MNSGSVVFSNEKIKPKGLAGYSKIAVLTDSNTLRYCYPLIKASLPAHEVIEVKPGEEQKNVETCKLIWQRLTDLNLDRHSLLIVLGGGVLGDMGGFCAATFKRGIDFILIPTTLLAQVDASIGGKLGVDFNNFKNHIGVFCEPRMTIISSSFLKTLPERELRSGFAEVVKHCIISDKAMWQIISKKKLNDQNWTALVKHSVNFKKSITAKDPCEKGLRKILNFGHTIGHALETYFLMSENRIYHGEAIAMGMIMEAFIAAKKQLLGQKQLDEIASYLIQLFGMENATWDDARIVELIAQDKKNKGKEILMALPKGIGKAQWDISVSRKELTDSFDYYRSL